MTNDSTPICNSCQDDEASCLTNTKEYGWICDHCMSDVEYYDRHCEEYEERKRKRLFEAQEY